MVTTTFDASKPLEPSIQRYIHNDVIIVTNYVVISANV